MASTIVFCRFLATPPAGGSRPRSTTKRKCTYKNLTWDDFRGPIVNGQQAAWIASYIVIEPVLVEMVDSEGGGVVARARNPIVDAVAERKGFAARLAFAISERAQSQS